MACHVPLHEDKLRCSAAGGCKCQLFYSQSSGVYILQNNMVVGGGGVFRKATGEK